MELAEFLLARISEDEAAARAATPGPWGDEFGGVCTVASPFVTVAKTADLDLIGIEGYTYGPTNQERADATHIARHDPARVLAECEAKRRIIERQKKTHEAANRKNAIEYHGSAHGLMWAMKALALPYADHPDYRAEWRP